MLFVSAIWDPSIRWLHFFQAWMYLVAAWWSLRRSVWGYFIGLSAAGLWAYSNLFVTTFFVNGLQQLSLWIRSGHLARPDLLIAVPAWLANLLVVIGCGWGYLQLRRKNIGDLARLAIAFVLTTGSSLWIWQFSNPGIWECFLTCCTRACLGKRQISGRTCEHG